MDNVNKYEEGYKGKVKSFDNQLIRLMIKLNWGKQKKSSDIIIDKIYFLVIGYLKVVESWFAKVR